MQETKEQKTETKNNWDKPQVGCLYKATTVNGTSYFKGYFETVDELGVGTRHRVVIYPNRHKTEDRHPDLKIYLDVPSNSATNPKNISGNPGEANSPAKKVGLIGKKKEESEDDGII